jgi:hypothetical protein
MDANKNLTQGGLAFGLGLDSVAYSDLRTSAVGFPISRSFVSIRGSRSRAVSSLLPTTTKSINFLQVF